MSAKNLKIFSVVILAMLIAAVAIKIRVNNLKVSYGVMATDRDINASAIFGAVRSLDIRTKGTWRRDYEESKAYYLSELIRRYGSEMYRCKGEDLWGGEYKFILKGGEFVIFAEGFEEAMALPWKSH